MKKLTHTILLLLLLTALSYAQPFKFGWITDLHIGSPKAEEYMRAIVEDINKRSDLQFVIATGDIAEKGRNDELDTAKQILDNLKIKYYIIPGNHDSKWSESGFVRFAELWGNTRFNFDFNGIRFIGLNSAIPWKGGGGHFAADDLKWLDDQLSRTDKAQEIIFCAHHPLTSEVDNWFEVTNRLRGYNIRAILVGHGHTNKLLDFNGIPAAMGRSTLGDAKRSWGYTQVENTADSLFFSEINRDSIPEQWGAISKTSKLEIPKVDSAQFLNYNSKLLWQKDLGTTMVTPVLVWNGKVYSASKDGTVSCFDQSGNTLWQYKSGGTIFSRPVIADNILAVGTIQGDLITIDAESGSVLQTIGIGEPITSQLLTFGYNGDKKLMSGAKPDTVVILGTATGKLVCYDLHTLDPVWENNSAKGMIETLPLYVENKLVYGSWDNYLYCVDARSGVMNWKWTGNKNFYYSPAACTPVSDGKNVYVATPDKFVSAVDLLLGKTVWRKDNFPCWESIGISSNKENLLIKGYTDNFYVVNAQKGKLVKEINIKFGLDTTPVTPLEESGNIIFGSKNGIVYLIDKDFNFKPLLFTGTARVLTIEQTGDNTFAATNMDGKILVFSINQDGM